MPTAKDSLTQLRYTAQARRDLLDIWLGVAVDDQAAADRIYDRLEERVTVLTRFPEIGPRRPEIVSDARILIEAPYLVLYRILPTAVQIVRVLHGARHIDSSLFEEGIA